VTDDQILDLLRAKGPLRVVEIHQEDAAAKLLRLRERWWARFVKLRTLERIAPFMAIGYGALYPMLLRLEHAGKIQSYWQPGDDYPRRRYYRIADPGVPSL
jgi:hypothetical protein